VHEIPLEAPPEDVVDQRAEVTTAGVEDDYGPAAIPRRLPLEANPADVAEQLAEVPLDDGDWG
jgi:hypothetical protein